MDPNKIEEGFIPATYRADAIEKGCLYSCQLQSQFPFETGYLTVVELLFCLSANSTILAEITKGIVN